MSALHAFRAEPPTDEAEPRLVGVAIAADIADCHPETVRDAARAGLLHGVQRKRIDPKTKQSRTKGGTWKFHTACVVKWAEGEECAHQSAGFKAPVALASFRGRK